MSLISLENALNKHYARNQRWGFTWALWTAILWGAWYVPGTALWFEKPYSIIDDGNQSMVLAATAVITWVHAISVLFFLFIWNLMLGKTKDYGRTLFRFRKISKWYALASLCGGPMAIFGSYMAMGFIGPVFAAITSLFYPVVGAIIAHYWYKEKITSRVALGMLVIILGGGVIFGPELLGELDFNNSNVWLGYLGAIMAAIGWGAEGAVAARAMDISDPDSGIQCRFTFEVLFWSVIIIPLIFLLTDLPVMQLISDTFNNDTAMLLIMLASACHAYSYTAFYKSFSLIGVARGEAIGNLHAVFAVLFVVVFTLEVPEWYFFIGLLLATAGSLIMFAEPAESVAQLRDQESPS